MRMIWTFGQTLVSRTSSYQTSPWPTNEAVSLQSYPMSNICNWCNYRLMRLIPKYWRRDYIEDSREIASINAKAKKGCTICRLLREGLVALQANVEDAKCRVMTIAVPTLDQRQFTLQFRYSPNSGTSSKRFTFCLQGTCHTPVRPLEGKRSGLEVTAR